MLTIKHILFPVDFSERCGAIRPFVRAAAKRFDAKLTLLHAVPYPITLSGGFEAPPYPVIPDITPALNAAKAKFDTFFNAPELSFVNRIVEEEIQPL